MAILMLSVFFAAILAVQLPPLWKDKNWREILAYSFFMLTGMIYSYGYVLDIKLPNPTAAVDAVFRPFTELLDKLLS